MVQDARKKIILIAVVLTFLVVVWHSGSEHASRLLKSSAAAAADQIRTKAMLFLRNAGTSMGGRTGDDMSKREWPWRYRLHPLPSDKDKWVGVMNMTDVNCSYAYSLPPSKASKDMNKAFPQKADRFFPYHVTQLRSDCNAMREKFGLERYPRPTQEELDFPLAFSIIFYHNLDQMIYMLRSIYHPHNVYCLHLDSKSSAEIQQGAQDLANCLPNVFMASRLYHVIYAGFNRLKADVQCMGDLLKSPVQWKYFINLPGSQFPLRTNLEMVKILQIFNGSNDIEGVKNPRRMLRNRYLNRHEYLRDKKGNIKHRGTGKKNPPPPHGFKMVKGSAYGTFSRGFVDYIVNDREAQGLLEWHRHVSSPDEYFWATLHHDARAPGGFTGKPDKTKWLSSYSLWIGERPGCKGSFVHAICIFSPGDLSYLRTLPHLFANKFKIEENPAALHCLDHWIYNKTLDKYTRDLDYYRHLPFTEKNVTRT